MTTGGPPEIRMWQACMDLLRRGRVRSVSLVWSASTGSTWSAAAVDEAGNRTAVGGMGPAMALAALTEKVASTCRCECGRPIAISERAMFNGRGACRWQLIGDRFRSQHAAMRPGGAS